MTLSQLAEEYRYSSSLVRDRIEHLKSRLDNEPMCNMDKLRLRIRIEKLSSIMRQDNETALFLERYYDRRFKKNARFTV